MAMLKTICVKLILGVDIWSHIYTGNVQTFTTPHSIYYTLEIWGASGFAATSYGGFGGYAFGYKYLSAGVNIYICTSMYVRMNGDLACVLTSETVK